MNFFKKITTAVLCIIISLIFSFTAFAENDKLSVSISNETAFSGETVTVSVNISNNPGIKIMSFCITYNSDILEYKGYNKGYLKNYTVQNYSDGGYIIFLSKESADIKQDGMIISIDFKIKDGAKSGKYQISLANRNEKYGSRLHNSFYTNEQKYIEPTVKTGSVTVAENCETDGHKFGEWTQVTAPTCTTDGLKQRTCTRCNNYSETEKIPAAHDFENDWTVDRAATPQTDGIMSRHCKNCNAVTDKITFTYTEAQGDQTTGNTSENNGSHQTDSSNSDVKIPLNNTVGSKNELSAVKDLNDYIQNVKPKNDDTSTTETTDMSDTSENESNFVSESDNVYDTNSNTEANITQSDNTNFKTVITAIALALIISLLTVFAAVIITKHKKSKTESEN